MVMAKQLKLPKGNGKDKGMPHTKESKTASRAGFADYCPHCKYLTCQCHRIKERQILDRRPVAEVTAAKQAMQERLKEKFVKHHVGVPADEDLIDGNNYVIGEDGMYLIVKNKIGKFVTRANKIPFVTSTPREGFQMNLERKIPYDFLLQTIAFFKQVIKDRGNAEAMIQVLQNPDGEYFIHVADQEVSGASVKFKRDAEFEKANLLVLDIHSHNNMGAFWSGTDNHDEKEARMYGVIGSLRSDWPQMKFRVGNGSGGFIDLEQYDVFETPDVAVEIPTEWMAKVHKPGKFFKGHEEQDRGRQRWPVGGGYPGRRVFGGDERPWGRDLSPSGMSFGPAGSAEQDMLRDYAFDRWAEETGFDKEDTMHSTGFSRTDVADGIEALVESFDILPDEEAKSMAIALASRLDNRSKDILHEVLSGTK
jgi:PRTRC genetic system protein A